MEYILPQELFEELATGLLLFLLGIAIVFIAKGADSLVEGAVGVSERLNIPKVIIGATIVSLGTTTPEAAVSVMAAFKGLPEFALGNSVGSIICDTGLIFGLSCLFVRLPKDSFVLNRHGWIQFGSGVLLVVISLMFWNADKTQHIIPRSAGFFLVALLVGYLYISMIWAKQHNINSGEKNKSQHSGSIAKDFIRFVIGLFFVVLSSHLLLQTVRIICVRWGVPPAVVAATLIAFGTSLPELITAITCIRKGHTELLVGNIIGADILNVLFVSGAAACASPLLVEPLFLKLHFPVMIAVLVLFRLTIHFSKKSFARWPGILFLALYVFFVVGSYLMS